MKRGGANYEMPTAFRLKISHRMKERGCGGYNMKYKEREGAKCKMWKVSKLKLLLLSCTNFVASQTN